MRNVNLTPDEPKDEPLMQGSSDYQLCTTPRCHGMPICKAIKHQCSRKFFSKTIGLVLAVAAQMFVYQSDKTLDETLRSSDAAS